MTKLLTTPPPAGAIAAMSCMQGVHIAPTILVSQRGPDGHLGPEAAGAVLMLQATFADPLGVERFWAAAVPLMQVLESAPGFIRRYSFPDGPSITLIAFWRTVADARAFADRPEHRAAVRDLYKERWQYSHFSALWAIASNHGRTIFCRDCDGIAAAGSPTCGGCGADLIDIYSSDA
jgi:hypothetical protein